MSRTVIIGGHGKVALLTAPLLVAAGHDVVSVIRDPAQADDVAATGATPLVLSVEDAGVGELARALAGADAVVWSAGAGGKGRDPLQGGGGRGRGAPLRHGLLPHRLR